MDIGPAHPGDRFLGAEHGAFQCVALPQSRRKLLVSNVGGIILVHVDLFEDNVLLRIDFRLTEGGAAHHLGQDVDAQRQIIVAQSGPIARLLLAGEGIRTPPDCIEGLGNLLCGQALTALEQEMLEEMGGAGLIGVLVAGAGVGPHPQRHRPNIGHRVGDNPQTVGKSR